MSSPIDLLTDKLADAPLTLEQRGIWRDLCAELVLARVRVQELETRLKILERDDGTEKAEAEMLNRPDFNREIARMLAFDERYDTKSSVVYFNVDNLEAIRVRHGAAVVDAALRCVTTTLGQSVRRSDSLGRLAFDEFGVLLPRCDNANAWKKGEAIAEKLYAALTELWGPGLRPEISFGAYTFEAKEDVAAGLKQAARTLTKLGKKG